MKSTQAEVAARVDAILKMRLLGAEFHDIRDYANNPRPEENRPAWNVSDSQLHRYIAASDKQIGAALKSDTAKILNRHIAMRRALFARCMAVSDYANARGVLKDEAELMGLYPPKALRISNVTDEDIERAVNEELARMAAGGSRALSEPAAPEDPLAGIDGRPDEGDEGSGNEPGPVAGTVTPLFE